MPSLTAPMKLELRQMAIHYVEPEAARSRYAAAEKQVAELEKEAVDFLVNMAVEQVVDAPARRGTSAGMFAEQGEHAKLVRGHVAAINAGGAGFFPATVAMARHLQRISPPQASPGILAVLRLVQPAERGRPERPLALFLKIQHDQRAIVRLLEAAPTELKVERLQQVLVDKLLKGACLPHPHRPGYDAKLVDKQASSQEPAQYFTRQFLNVAPRYNDAFQATRLVDHLQRFADAQQVPLAPQKLPQVVAALEDHEGDITGDVVLQAVEATALFGAGFATETLSDYLEQELNPIDIRQEVFRARGRTREKKRQVTLEFRDPALRELAISGPAALVGRLLAAQGDAITFHLETTRDALRVRYD